MTGWPSSSRRHEPGGAHERRELVSPCPSAPSVAQRRRRGRGVRCGVRPLPRSEEHTSELQSRGHLVCRLLLEKKKELRNRSEHANNRQVATSNSNPCHTA